MTDNLACVHRMYPFTWEHKDVTPGREIPSLLWCIWNADGSYFVDWERAEYLAHADIAPFWDMQQVNQQMMARMLLSARGKFTEVTAEEAHRIAEDAGARREAAHSQGRATHFARTGDQLSVE